jgi:hypothetical protein
VLPKGWSIGMSDLKTNIERSRNMARQENIEADKNTRTHFPDRGGVKSGTAGVTEEASERGKEQLEAGKDAAADQAESLAGVGERVAQNLRGELPSLADYTGELAGSIRELGDQLRHRNIDELLADAQAVARRNPTLFLVGSVAIGVGLSRFFKASTESRGRSPVDPAGTSIKA